MSYHHRGVYITLLAAAWDNGGWLPAPAESAARAAKVDPRSVRDFLSKYPQCFISLRSTRLRRDLEAISSRSWLEIEPILSRDLGDFGSKLVNPRLLSEWLKYNTISEKRRSAAKSRYPANAEQKHLQKGGSAFASASASANLTTTPPLPPSRGGNGLTHDDLLKDEKNYTLIQWRGEDAIVIRTNGKRRLFTERQRQDLSIVGIVEYAIEKIRAWGYWCEKYVPTKPEERPV